MSKQPLVTVLGLSMNHEQYVEQAYKSVINQTYKNIEILYLDNASRDKTFEVADKIFRESGLSYKGFKQLESRGISPNLNFLLHQAKGQFVAVLSGDDWWEPDNIEKKIDFFLRNPDHGMAYSNGYIYVQKEKRQELFYKEPQKSGWLFKDFLQGNFLYAVSVIVNFEKIGELAYYDENSPIEDWDMWLRISEKFQVGYLHEPSVYSRHTGSNLSGNLEFMNKGYNYIFTKYKAHPEIAIAHKNIRLGQAYQLATNAPGLKSLSYILKNFQWNIRYGKQVVRCLLGMTGLMKKKK